MVEWIAFFQVAVATIVSALVVSGLYGLGVRLQAVAEDDHRSRSLVLTGAWTCFVLCGLLVLFGIILIVPALSSFFGLSS